MSLLHVLHIFFDFLFISFVYLLSWWVCSWMAIQLSCNVVQLVNGISVACIAVTNNGGIEWLFNTIIL